MAFESGSEPCEFEILDARFDDCIRKSARLERLASGCRWTEGPVYVPAQRRLLWSDIPNERMLSWCEVSGHVAEFRRPSSYTNGHTLDRQGRLISCEQGGRRVVRTEHDGSLTVLASHFGGQRLNSPNDVVVKSDGTVWFTDPPYGICDDYEGVRAPQEQAGCWVYRLDPVSGELRVMADNLVHPNGLAFSPDERCLYVADTGVERGTMHRFAVDADGSLSGGEVFIQCDTGFYDGFRCDTEGRIWTSAGRAIHCHAPDGALIGRIPVPERVSNVSFGGPKRNRLFICATSSVYSVLLAVNGVKPC
ncbi:SMP-30/gluconolactonase/LRE family protein [Roseateles sp. NT4]|uniref:SMP-30/gluconolactonase/LRE family protein n=1 Tax=Roseateles sp. NT4 TaxID=3453715 RepID=UPI003EE8AEE6